MTQGQQGTDKVVFDEQEGRESIDELCEILEMMEEIGAYRQESKEFYQTMRKELHVEFKLCAYHMAHQFYYLTKKSYALLNSRRWKAGFYSLSEDDLNCIHLAGDLDPEIKRLAENIEDSKKLLKVCYDSCKALLPPAQCILQIDGDKNYFRECLASLAKEYHNIDILIKALGKNEVLSQRCAYLIGLAVAVRKLNGEELAIASEEWKDNDPSRYIVANRHLLIPN